MRRREFITLIGNAAAAWPFAAHAQQPKRRIGVLMSLVENDPEGEPRVRAFVDGLQQLGWTDGRNVRIDIRWAGDPADTGKYAAELVALAPDVIFASAGPNVAALHPFLDRASIRGPKEWRTTTCYCAKLVPRTFPIKASARFRHNSRVLRRTAVKIRQYLCRYEVRRPDRTS